MRSRTAPSIADDAILSILETDRAWCAYAMADLSTPWREKSSWMVHSRSLVLIFRGLTPPILFSVGEPESLRGLFDELPPGQYWHTLRPTDFSLLQPRIREFSHKPMWRMRLTDDDYKKSLGGATQLGIGDLEQIDSLFASQSDGPDAYSIEQIKHGIYYGVVENETLQSVAGTHVVDVDRGVAAVGNVYTAPNSRRRGYGSKASAAVVAHLVELGIDTIVLNVEMANQSAIEMYRSLGFMPYCGFYEGISVLT